MALTCGLEATTVAGHWEVYTIDLFRYTVWSVENAENLSRIPW